MNFQMRNKSVIETIVPTCDKLQDMTDVYSTERYEPPSISVDERGMILDCSNSCERFLGYRRRDLVLLHVSRLFPLLTEIELMQKGSFNPALIFLCRCGKLFQAKNRLGDTFFCNFNFVHLDNNGKHTLKLIVTPADNARSQFPYSFEY